MKKFKDYYKAVVNPETPAEYIKAALHDYNRRINDDDGARVFHKLRHHRINDDDGARMFHKLRHHIVSNAAEFEEVSPVRDTPLKLIFDVMHVPSHYGIQVMHNKSLKDTVIIVYAI